MRDEMGMLPESEQPSSGRLLRSTLIAAGVAALLLVTVVLPAEYAVDPTGIGRVIGLTRMGEVKMQLAREAALADSLEAVSRQQAAAQPQSAGTPEPPPTQRASAQRSDVTEVTLRPGEGKEIKLAMREGAQVQYSWITQGGVVNFDKHADSTNPPRSYFGYNKGSAVSTDEGVLTAAFDGMHGWFWRNRGGAAVTVTLRTDGDYQELKRIE